MAAITIAPIVLKDVVLNIPATTGGEYGGSVEQVTFNPHTNPQTWIGLGGNVVTVPGITTWDVTISLAQDWTTADSLSQYLMDHEGESVDISFLVDGAETFTSTVTVLPGAIGGNVNSIAKSSVTLPCTAPVHAA